MKTIPTLILLAGLPLLAVTFTAVRAAGNDDCLMCHSDAALEMVRGYMALKQGSRLSQPG